MSNAEPNIKIGSINDLIAVAPCLVGYAPDHQLVILGVDEPTRQMTLAICAELPQIGRTHSRAHVEELREKLLTRPVTAAYLLAYGTGSEATPTVDAVRTELTGHGIRVLDALRIADGRYWSYLDTTPDHGSPEGTPIDSIGSATVMEAAVAGWVPFRDRSEVAATIAPIGGAARSAMRAATETAEELVNGARTVAPDRATTDHRTATYRFLPRAADYYSHGEIIDDTRAALLAIALTDTQIRDVAITLTAHGDTRGYLALWTDLARRVEPDYRVPVLSLLAFAAWRDGGGAMPNIATDAALAADPHYTFAGLMRELLRHGIHGPTFDVPQPGDVIDS